MFFATKTKMITVYNDDIFDLKHLGSRPGESRLCEALRAAGHSCLVAPSCLTGRAACSIVSLVASVVCLIGFSLLLALRA